MHCSFAKTAGKYLRCGNQPCKIYNMICHHCLGCLRLNDDLDCEKKYRTRATSVTESSECHEGGDRGYQWKCVVCRNSICNKDNSCTKESLLLLINSITEKFELVNKIQIPKLNNDLTHIKSVTEQILKQNEDILRKVTELENKAKIGLENKTKVRNETHNDVSRTRPKYTYRKRSFTIASKPNKSANMVDSKEKKEFVTSLSLSDKNLLYRTRRRSYALHKMFLLLNNRSRQRSPRRRTRNI